MAAGLGLCQREGRNVEPDCRVLARAHRQVAAPGVVYEIDPPLGPVRCIPKRDVETLYSRYGEADLKAALYATEVAEGLTLVKTIDWDMIVQGAAVFPATVVVDLGNVWRKNSTTFFRSGRRHQGQNASRNGYCHTTS